MFAIESGVKPPRIKKPKNQRTPENVRKAFDAYNDAYKKVYGVRLDGFTYNNASRFVYIERSRFGVSLKRLKEMTRMLNARVE